MKTTVNLRILKEVFVEATAALGSSKVWEKFTYKGKVNVITLNMSEIDGIDVEMGYAFRTSIKKGGKVLCYLFARKQSGKWVLARALCKKDEVTEYRVLHKESSISNLVKLSEKDLMSQQSKREPRACW